MNKTHRTSRRWIAFVAALALVLAACSSSTAAADQEDAGTEPAPAPDGAGTDLGPTADELNTVAVAARFGPSTAALSVRVSGQQMIGGVEAPTPGQQSSGSGFVIEFEGERFLVTNFHVVEPTLDPGTSDVRSDSTIVAVFGEDGTTATALTVVGVNPSFDLALLEATNGDEIPELEAIPIGDSDAVQIGQKTIAVGNPFGLGATVTTGIVSSTERFIRSVGGVDIPMIQTDAAINPGNSGGALLSSSGELIGINTSIFNPEAGAFAGIGFSVPSNLLVESLENLETGGVSLLSDTRPDIGADLGNISGLPASIRSQAGLPDFGIAVLSVDPGGAADDAGLRTPDFIDVDGLPIPVDPDIILEVDGVPVLSASELNTSVTYSSEEVDTITLTVLRDGEEIEVVVNLTLPG